MATAGLTCVVRQSLRKLVHPERIRFVATKSKVVLSTPHQPRCPCSFYSSSPGFRNEVTVKYDSGLPVISVPLPSRKENCEFTLKPVTHTVGDFIKFLQTEDGGIDRAAIYAENGSKIAKSTTIDILLRSNFKVNINEEHYTVCPPPLSTKLLPSEDLDAVGNVKTLVSNLFTQLNVEQHQIEREKKLLAQLEDLRLQIEPMEKIHAEINERSLQRNTQLVWAGLGFMSLEFGFLARLTWWEYSWDIMEPVTYFVGFGTSMVFYAYAVLTRQEFHLVEVGDRQYLLSYYKRARKAGLDLQRYNQLKDSIADIEYQLKRLRDPLQIHLPIREIEE